MSAIEDEPCWDLNARKIAEKRFPDIDLDSMYYISELLPKKCKRRSRIKEKAETLDHIWRAAGFDHWYYKITPNDIVFVVALPETIISVFTL